MVVVVACGVWRGACGVFFFCLADLKIKYPSAKVTVTLLWSWKRTLRGKADQGGRAEDRAGARAEHRRARSVIELVDLCRARRVIDLRRARSALRRARRGALIKTKK